MRQTAHCQRLTLEIIAILARGNPIDIPQYHIRPTREAVAVVVVHIVRDERRQLPLEKVTLRLPPGRVKHQIVRQQIAHERNSIILPRETIVLHPGVQRAHRVLKPANILKKLLLGQPLVRLKIQLLLAARNRREGKKTNRKKSYSLHLHLLLEFYI